MISVLVVNDQALHRHALRLFLTSQPGLTVVGEAASGSEAVHTSASLGPDVVLMDSHLLRTDGIEAIQRIAQSSRLPQGLGGRTLAPRVLVLTPTRHDTHAHAALRAGASGFLLADVAPDELMAALHVVAAGDAVITPGLTRALIDAVRREHGAHGSFPSEAGLDTLTRRERDVLVAVASGWTNAEIAERLSIAPTTVKTHVSHILTKIGARARVQAVTIAYEAGLIRPAA